MHSASWTIEQYAGVDLQLESLKDLPIRCLRSAGRAIRRYGSLLIGAVVIVAVPAVLLCSLVFAMSIFMRGDGLTHGPSANDAMLLVATSPLTSTPQSSKAGRLAVSPSSDRLTEGSILAAYRRTVVSPYAQQNAAALFAMATDNEAQNALDVEAALIPAAPSVVAEVEKVAPLPIPAAKPAFEWRPAKPIAPKAPPAVAETVKPAPQAPPVQLAALPAPTQPVEGNPGLLSRRTAPDTSPRIGFPWPGRNDRTAIYDISAGVVYLPNGEKLEAHSGVGHMRDNPNYIRVKMLGPTPPATYALSMREAIFHGVAAIRLTPVNGVAPFGREGLLAHTYMLRNPGDSNGCVVFADYNRFLKAFRNNEIAYITVVTHLEDRITWLGLGQVWG